MQRDVLIGVSAGVFGSLLGGLGVALLVVSPASGSASEGPVRREVSVPGRDVAAGTDMQELRADLQRLTRAVSSLEATWTARNARDAAQTARVPVEAAANPGAESTADAHLVGVLRELARSLRQRSSGGTLGLRPPAFVERGVALETSQLRQALQADDESRYEAECRALQERHRFWSYQELLDAYGSPDQIWVNEGVTTWEYERRESGAYLEELEFQIHEGLVFSVDYDCNLDT